MQEHRISQSDNFSTGIFHLCPARIEPWCGILLQPLQFLLDFGFSNFFGSEEEQGWLSLIWWALAFPGHFMQPWLRHDAPTHYYTTLVQDAPTLYYTTLLQWCPHTLLYHAGPRCPHTLLYHTLLYHTSPMMPSHITISHQTLPWVKAWCPLEYHRDNRLRYHGSSSVRALAAHNRILIVY